MQEKIYRDKLKTCPICNRKVGIVPHYLYGNIRGYSVICDCGLETKVFRSIQALTNYWNRRKGE